MNRKSNTLTAFLALAFLLVFLSGCAANETPPADGGQIAIPGYETLYFLAGRTRQSVDFSNPKENACLFRLSLALDSGETLWTSENLKPGKSVKTLTLSRPLNAGEYVATLKYDCFSLTDNTPLNGAEIALTIEVA